MKCKMIGVFVFRLEKVNTGYYYKYITVESIPEYNDLVRIGRIRMKLTIGWDNLLKKKLTKNFLREKDVLLNRFFVDVYKDVVDVDPEIIGRGVFHGQSFKLLMKYKIKT